MTDTAASSTLQQINDAIPSGANIEVKGIDRSMSDSTVYLTANLATGGEQDFTIKLVRDGIGWKVSSVETTYASQGSTGTTTTSSTSGSTSGN